MNDRQAERATAAHYDGTPFEFMTDADLGRLEQVQPAAFVRYAREHVHAGDRVADVGCGPGRATAYLQQLGAGVVAVDISHVSLSLARKRAPQAAFVQASNLSLPFATGSFDAVVSDGVIHHTPDARRSFAENARILAPGGTMYVGVYRRHRYYYYLYTYAGRPVRALNRTAAGRALISCTLLPVYYAVHLAKSRGTRTWQGARSFFHDYILTPRATFHTREEIEAWGREEGLELLHYDPHVGNVHAFTFRKRGTP